MKAERDATLVMDALMMAVWRRGKADALLHHSDQGSQYTSEQFQRLLADNGITCSMSRAGNVWDNSAMESFFSSLKIERTNRKVYRTRDEARADVFEPPRVYRRAKLSENCPLWNMHKRRRPRSRIHPSSVNVRCGFCWNTAMSIKAKLRR